jgi:hypothetical protein
VRVPTVVVLADDGSPVALDTVDAVAASATGATEAVRLGTFDAAGGRYSVVVDTARDPRLVTVAVGADPLGDTWALVWPPLVVMALFWLAAASLAALAVLRRRPDTSPALTEELAR